MGWSLTTCVLNGEMYHILICPILYFPAAVVLEFSTLPLSILLVLFVSCPLGILELPFTAFLFWTPCFLSLCIFLFLVVFLYLAEGRSQVTS